MAEPGAALRFTVVGCAPAWDSRSRGASSCYLVEHRGQALVLDIGQGAFAALARYVDPAGLSAVLVSHGHADHCVDLIPLRHYLTYAVDPPRCVRLHGPAELRSRFDAFTGEKDFLACLPGEPLTEGAIEAPPFEVTARRVLHADESFAFRLAVGGRPAGEPGLVYSGDCGDPADLVPLVRPGDTLVCEALFGARPAEEGPHHLDARLAAEVAREGDAARLVLTHMLDGADRAAARRIARRVYAGEVLTARPGLAIDL